MCAYPVIMWIFLFLFIYRLPNYWAGRGVTQKWYAGYMVVTPSNKRRRRNLSTLNFVCIISKKLDCYHCRPARHLCIMDGKVKSRSSPLPSNLYGHGANFFLLWIGVEWLFFLFLFLNNSKQWIQICGSG
jgi:hypothetical protein